MRKGTGLATGLAVGAVLAIGGGPVAAEDAVWGSLDASRINYGGGDLNGSGHTELRAMIAANGDSVAAGAVEVTADYLDGVTVFYTSLLNTNTGSFSSSELDALHDWIADGGTLIVTAEYINPHQYEPLTAPYGVDNYVGLGNRTVGFPVDSHPIVDGVVSYFLAGETTFDYGSDALLIGDNGLGAAALCVLDSSTGFTGGGQIFVIGDHNCFTNSYMFEEDNPILAENMVAWAAEGGGGINLSLSGNCPGTITADVTGATPGGFVGFVYAFGTGNFVIPGGVCAGTELGLDNTTTLAGVATANGAGEASLSGNVPSGACGNVFIQAVDASTCSTSNVEGV